MARQHLLSYSTETWDFAADDVKGCLTVFNVKFSQNILYEKLF